MQINRLVRAGLSLLFSLGIAVSSAGATSAGPQIISQDGGTSAVGQPRWTGNPGNGTTTNWSGVVASGANFSSVTSSWTVPAVSCPSSGSLSSYFWVGLGGWNGNQVLEQLGTAQWCRNGVAHYGLFAEFYSNPPIAGDGGEYPGYPVRPGDTVTATVTKLSNGRYRLSETSSRGWTFSVDGNAPGNDPGNLSAEVIAEAPGAAGTPLANFGTAYFNNILYYSDKAADYALYDIQYNGVQKTASSENGSGSVKVQWLRS